MTEHTFDRVHLEAELRPPLDEKSKVGYKEMLRDRLDLEGLLDVEFVTHEVETEEIGGWISQKVESVKVDEYTIIVADWYPTIDEIEK